MNTETGKTAAAGTRGDNAAAGPFKLQKRIGSIVYEVEVHFNPDTKERMKDKILRLIRRETESVS